MMKNTRSVERSWRVKANWLRGVLILFSACLNPLAYAESAEEIYLRACNICHGYDGSGSMPGVPDLSDSEALLRKNDAALIERIKSGINQPGKVSMPPKGGDPTLTDDQLVEVLQYIKTLIKR